MTLLGVKWSSISDVAVDLVDIVEVAGWDLERGQQSARRLLHNLDLDFSLATPNALDDSWIERCQRSIALTGSPWFSLHLGFSAERVTFRDHMLPESPVLDRGTCLERMVDAVGYAQRHLDVPVLIENLDYCPEGAYEHVCVPEFIAEVVSATGCWVLLDLAHLQVSADWLGYSPEDYASRLPLERVIEIHVSSPRQVESRLDDGHFELVERDCLLLEWTLKQCEPRAVILEYARDRNKLREQLQGIRAILDRHAARVGKL